MEAEVEAARPGMVVLAQTYYPPWHAYVDGQPTRLWKADYAFQALEVPAGRHKVDVVYEDGRFRAGGCISLASLLGCAAIWIGGTQKDRSGGSSGVTPKFSLGSRSDLTH